MPTTNQPTKYDYGVAEYSEYYLKHIKTMHTSKKNFHYHYATPNLYLILCTN